MAGIVYLFFTMIKNAVKEFFKRPSKIITGVFFILMIVLVLVSGQMGNVDREGTFRSAEELSALVLALYTVIFGITAYHGVSSGASFYSMADVNILFSCPISTKRILLYGLIRQMGMSLMIGLVLLFQYAWLHMTYNLSIPGLLLILLGYAITMFCGQLAAMVIYSFTAGDDKRRGLVKGAFLAVLLLCVAGIAVPALMKPSGDLVEAFVSSANAPWTIGIPVAGWVRGIVALSIGGDVLQLALGLLLTVLFVAVLLLLQTRTKADFYEDVLKATEISYSAITAKKEGKMADAIPQNVKVGKTGLGSRKDPFFAKHLLEDRRGKLFLVDTVTLIMAVTAYIFAFIMREGGLILIFCFVTYLQIFTTINGRWLKELTFPYVYMVPQSAFRKLVSICKQNVVKILAEAVVVMIPIGIILGASVPEIVALVFARIGFGILFMGGNILTERLLGSLGNRVIIMGLYFMVMILLAVPGIIIGILLGNVIPGAFAGALGFFATFLWNGIIAGVIAFFCRDILNYAELNNR